MGHEPDIDHTASTACRIRVLGRDIVGFVNRILEPHGVSSSQADFLYFLLRDWTSPTEIAAAMQLDASNLSRMIRQFEEKGWLVRKVDEANRTRVELSLTKAGREMALKIDPHADVVQKAIEASLTREEFAVLERAIRKVSAALESPQEG